MVPKSLTEASMLLSSKKISSVELTEYYLNRINTLDKKIHAMLHTNPELSLSAARAADNLRQSGDTRLFLGIPLIHKDIFVTQNMPTTCGSRMLQDYMSPFDAQIVIKGYSAGMICLGKANMDEFAMGSSNETSYYGPVLNPWNAQHVPGGSSGGSAAAVAAGYALVATASDTGGSIRQPASFCGVTGLKPTYGRISRHGMIAFSSSLDQAGVITTSAEDAAHMLNIFQGKDHQDPTSAHKPLEDFTRDLHTSVKGKILGIPQQFIDNLSPSIEKVLQDTIATYQELGAQIIILDMPSLPYAISTYYILAPAEASSNLARYDGICYGYRSPQASTLDELYFNSRHDGFGLEVKRRILLGTFVLSSSYHTSFYDKALQARTMVQRDFSEAFNKADIILGPTAPSTAFILGEHSKDPVAMYQSDMFTIAVNLAGLPAMSIPAGMDNNLPIGIQLIGNHFDESKLLSAAHQFQLHTSWHTQTPLFEGF